MNGVLPLLKPPGMTSQQAVSRVKSLLGVSRAGHAGTLDPGACGVLPVCVGRATKLSDYLMQLPKTYVAQLTLGASTDTLDSEGTVLTRSDARVGRADMESVLADFTGEILQTPPLYSAIKDRGKPLYRYAREGTPVARAPRRVRVDEISLLESDDDSFLFRIACGKGTYVRSLLEDLASRHGAAGYTSFLLRTRCGGFTLEETVTLDEVERGAFCLRSPEQAVGRLPRLDLPAFLYGIVDSGAAIDPERARIRVPEGLCAVFCRGVFFGVGTLEDGRLRLKTRIKV